MKPKPKNIKGGGRTYKQQRGFHGVHNNGVLFINIPKLNPKEEAKAQHAIEVK